MKKLVIEGINIHQKIDDIKKILEEEELSPSIKVSIEMMLLIISLLLNQRGLK